MTSGNLGNAIGGPWTKTFVYDDLYRLTSSTRTHNVSATPTFTYSFSQSYDSIHNITHKTQTAMQDTAVNPQITYDFAYSYPAAGAAHPHGPTAIGPFTISNDANGNQVNTLGTGTSDQSEYLYDEENRRILTKKSRIAPDCQHWYYHPDHLGSTAMVTNENGQLVDAIHYFPFGEVWLEERPASLPADYFFTAKEFDPETGFYDFGARYLDPRFSKWMTADPALGSYLSNRGAGSIHAPVNTSLYTYGWNNPATVRDPDGRCIEDFCVGEALLVLWAADKIYTAYTWYRDAKAVNNGEMTPEAFAVEHALDVLPGGGIAKRGVKGAEEAIKLGERALVKREERQLATQAEKLAVNEEKKAADGVREVEQSAGCSFDAGTPVTTSEGLKFIGELKTGDRVLARSEETGTYAFKPITQVFRHQDPVKVRLTLEDPATGATEVIETTPEHPFHVPGRGFVPTAALEAGDPVSRAPSVTSPFSVVRLRTDVYDALRVKELTLEHQPFWAYNLQIADLHTFFAGKSGAWVHNSCIRGPKTEPTAPHNAKIREEAQRLQEEGNTIVAGGGGKERLIPTPGGHKSGRRPDILFETPAGELRATNVGRTTANKIPVPREVKAMEDLTNKAGIPTNFVPYR